jgi:AtzH-like
MQIDIPEVVAEVSALFQRYERALMANDVAALNAFFWKNPLTLRFGVGENLYGYDAIAAYRRGNTAGSPRRTLTNTVITTFGRDCATANTEFQRIGSPTKGRQSQTWLRLPEGWRIVSAHVSLLP